MYYLVHSYVSGLIIIIISCYYKNAICNGEQEKEFIICVSKDPLNHCLQLLGKPRDAKRWTSGRAFLSHPHTHNIFLYLHIMYGLFKHVFMPSSYVTNGPKFENSSTTYPVYVGEAREGEMVSVSCS